MGGGAALLAGTNTTANHPVAATFFKQARKNGTKLIVIDPRRETIADHADYHCRIKPGTDVAFYNAMMHVIIEEELVDESFVADRTENFEALKELLPAGLQPHFKEPVTIGFFSLKIKVKVTKFQTILRTLLKQFVNQI